MGVLCSLCLPGHALSGGKCEKCESDVDMDQLRMIALVEILKRQLPIKLTI